MKIQTEFSRSLNLQLPLIVAPMFLVSNAEMLIAAAKNGAVGVIPSLNARSPEILKQTLNQVRESTKGAFGVNIIVQKTNIHAREHLKIAIDAGTPFFITSLGSPKEVIAEAHKIGAKVYCDVVNREMAKKVVDLGADGLIAVCSGAGGHAGPLTSSIFVPLLKQEFKVPVIAAGGVVDGRGMASMLALGADGVSVGTRFIASSEAKVTQGYKDAIINADCEDIVYTEKISGTPCSVIATDYVKKMGLHQNIIERWLSSNKQLRKYFKIFVQLRGMKLLEKAAHSPTYKDVWCAGQSAGLIHEVLPMKEIIENFFSTYQDCIRDLPVVN